MPDSKLLIVSATRRSPAGFVEDTLLGRSLRRLSFDERLEARPAFNNRAGLPAVYNRQIREENRDRILLFVHDDVRLDDCFVCDRLNEALGTFDLVGVAGSTRRKPGQPAWAWGDESERQYMSGGVAHGPQPGAAVSYFGAPGQRCVLLDGLFIAARCGTLLDRGVRFDERFMFHFYDMDLCRSAEAASLRTGTWPIAVTHGSYGEFGSPAWDAGRDAYLGKWGE